MITIDTKELGLKKIFPPIKIPQDGTKIGIEQLKNIINISLEASLQAQNIKSLKDAGWLKRIFGGYIKFAVFLLDTSIDIYKAAPILAKEVKDLDYSEILELVLYISGIWSLDEKKAMEVFNLFKKITLWLEDGVITFAELKEF